jgi:PAS domain S-box-containing protein
MAESARSATPEPECTVRLRPDGCLSYVDEAFCRVFGVEAALALNRPLAHFADPRDARRIARALRSLAPDHRSAAAEVRVPARTPPIHVRFMLLALFDSDERLKEIHGFGVDVTRETQADAAAARLAAIVADADDAIVSKTLEGVVTSWNPAAERMFGYAASEVVGRSITLIIPKERLHEETEILARLARGERTEHFQTQRLHKSGRLLDVSVGVSPLRDARGRVVGASKIARDVTGQRLAHDEIAGNLRSLETLYRLADLVGQARTREEVYEAGLDAQIAGLGGNRASILMFDDEGVMRFVAWRGLSERYRRAVDGHSPWTRDSPPPRPIVVADAASDPALGSLREEILAEGIRALAFVPLVSQQKVVGKFMLYFDEPRDLAPRECRFAEIVGRHVSFGLARVDAVSAAEAAYVRERNARSEADAARAAAEHANQAKDEFLAMLAHELRNPLGVIVHASQILELGASGAPELMRPISMVQRQSRHLASLLDDLLDVARITSGRIELHAAPLDLRDIVRHAVEAQHVRIEAKQQSIDVDLPEHGVPVTGDTVRLQQAIGNLVHNASKYTAARGGIRVALAIDGGEAVIRVRDDGIGIPPERLESIFDLFVQGSPSLARTEGGLGIGLTLVRRIVELHDGRVAARSAGLGQGSEFELRLPLARALSVQPQPRLAPPLGAPEGPVQPSRILIVEDNDDGREALATLLRQRGHEVLEAATAQQALDVAAARRPDVAFLDIGLPDHDGYAVAVALRASLGRHVPLVALTGYGQPADRERARGVGFDAHLLKPVTPDQILETLGRLLKA